MALVILQPVAEAVGFFFIVCGLWFPFSISRAICIESGLSRSNGKYLDRNEALVFAGVFVVFTVVMWNLYFSSTTVLVLRSAKAGTFHSELYTLFGKSFDFNWNDGARSRVKAEPKDNSLVINDSAQPVMLYQQAYGNVPQDLDLTPISIAPQAVQHLGQRVDYFGTEPFPDRVRLRPGTVYEKRFWLRYPSGPYENSTAFSHLLSIVIGFGGSAVAFAVTPIFTLGRYGFAAVPNRFGPPFKILGKPFN